MSKQHLTSLAGTAVQPAPQRIRIVSPGAWALDEAEINSVVKVLKQRMFYRHWGDEVVGFEGEFAKRVGASYAVALNSGTSALMCAFIALDLKAGDEVTSELEGLGRLTVTLT